MVDTVSFINHGGVVVIAKCLAKSFSECMTFEYLCSTYVQKFTSRDHLAYLSSSIDLGQNILVQTSSLNLLEAVTITSLSVTITCDINVHLNVDGDIHRTKLNDILAAFDFIQRYMHDRGGLLDVVITTSADDPSDVTVTNKDRTFWSLSSIMVCQHGTAWAGLSYGH